LHRAALKLLQKAILLSFKEQQGQAWSPEGKISNAVRTHLGELDSLIGRHGSLPNALKAMLAAGTASYDKVLEIQSRMDNLGE
jgi:hypothetical protein